MLAIGSDHAGFVLKEQLKAHLKETGVAFFDFGTDSEASCDYPEIAARLCAGVVSGQYELGILVCGTGVGMSMAANKARGIRAAHCNETYSAKYARLHNDANVLCMGARVVGPGAAEEICDVFLQTAFEGGRHQRRVDMIMELEK